LLRSLPSWCDVLHTCCNQCRYNISGFCQLVLAANVLIGAGTKETAGDGRAATPPLTLALRTRLVLSPRTRQASRDVHLHLHLRCTHGKNRRQRQSEMHCATGADAAYKGGLTPQPRQALGRRSAGAGAARTAGAGATNAAGTPGLAPRGVRPALARRVRPPVLTPRSR